MNRPGIRAARKQTEINVKERYNQAYKRYVETQFTYNSHCLLKKLCDNGQKQPNMQGVPLYKLMIQVTKIMMMNQLQLLFFGATVQQMNWKIIQNCLTPYLQQVQDITPKIKKDNYVKKMQFSLLLIAYIVKIYLNQESQLYDFKIRDLVRRDFDKMYQQWVQKVQNNFKFSPKHMNRLFKQLDKNKKRTKQQIVDYNKLVSDLFKNNNSEQEREKYFYRQQHRNTKQKEEQRHFQQRQKQRQKNNYFEEIPVQDQDDYQLPNLQDRGMSGRSQLSGLGLGKRQSFNQLFSKGEIKLQNLGLMKNFSQDDFMGNI